MVRVDKSDKVEAAGRVCCAMEKALASVPDVGLSLGRSSRFEGSVARSLAHYRASLQVFWLWFGSRCDAWMALRQNLHLTGAVSVGPVNAFEAGISSCGLLSGRRSGLWQHTHGRRGSEAWSNRLHRETGDRG